MGSPAVSVERGNATETIDAFKVLMEYLRHESFDAVMGLEIGGANGLEPLLAGSSKYFNRPAIDADWMGRVSSTSLKVRSSSLTHLTGISHLLANHASCSLPQQLDSMRNRLRRRQIYPHDPFLE